MTLVVYVSEACSEFRILRDGSQISTTLFDDNKISHESKYFEENSGVSACSLRGQYQLRNLQFSSARLSLVGGKALT